jgi:Family of unknown function (DUF6516)
MGRKRKAVLVVHDEVWDEDGWRVIVKVWAVASSKTNPDGVDYSLVLLDPVGGRVVGYDNHWPKGHHRHVLGEENVYDYRGIDALIEDFRADIARVYRSKR